MTDNTIEVLNGTLRTHSSLACAGDFCSVHNPSSHSMVRFPQYWDAQRFQMQRVCPHGIPHPDPDDLAYSALVNGEEFAEFQRDHDCCDEGCCAPVPVPGIGMVSL